MIGLERRRLMMAEGIPSENYIRGGLVFYIDGYDFTENKSWKTRVGNNSFEKSGEGNVTKLRDGGVSFDGSSWMQGTMNQLISVGDNYTFEICATLNQPIVDTTVYYFIAGGIRLGVFKDQYGGRICQSSRPGKMSLGGCKFNDIDTGKLFTASLSRNLGFMNLENRTSPYGYQYNNEEERIKISGSNARKTKCNIYAIRIYDRILTTSQILHNQREDIRRFKINV